MDMTIITPDNLGFKTLKSLAISGVQHAAQTGRKLAERAKLFR